MTSDHRVAGSSPAGCKYNSIKDLISIDKRKAPQTDLAVHIIRDGPPNREYSRALGEQRRGDHPIRRSCRHYATMSSMTSSWPIRRFARTRSCCDSGITQGRVYSSTLHDPQGRRICPRSMESRRLHLERSSVELLACRARTLRARSHPLISQE